MEAGKDAKGREQIKLNEKSSTFFEYVLHF